MDELDLLIDLHRGTDRQGPGGPEETRLALRLAGLLEMDSPRIADIGCGSGAASLLLAEELNASVVAVDLARAFLDQLEESAKKQGCAARIETRCESMDALSFGEASLDAIWSEGAIYNIGFEKGVRAWRKFLKPLGVLVVSELTWFTSNRP